MNLKISHMEQYFTLLLMKLLPIILLLISQSSIAKTIRIAVIDTGYDFNSNWPNASKVGLSKPKLCPTGHKDFTGTGLQDHHNHGTHVSGLIAKGLDDIDYCLIIIKFYDPTSYKIDNLKTSIQSIKWAIEQKVDIINYSGGGTIFDKEEQQAVLQALSNNIKIITAAGNEKSDIDKHHYYPAFYYPELETIVGNVDEHGEIIKSSNYGKSVTVYKMGVNVLSVLPDNNYGTMTGTSQSCALQTNTVIRMIHNSQNSNTHTTLKYLKYGKYMLAL